MRIRYWLFIAVVLTALSNTIKASPWQRYGSKEGLSTEETRQVISLPDGRILAVMEGLIDVFDGERFVSLDLDRRKTAPVHSFLNMNHYLDNKGRLWLRTLHLLSVIDSRTLQQVDVRALLSQVGVDYSRLQNCFVNDDGTAWLHVGEDSLMLTDWQQKATLMMRIDEFNAEGLRASVCDIVAAGDCHYIFFSNGRMVCMDAQTGRQRWATTVGGGSRGYYLRAVGTPRGDLIIRLCATNWQDMLVRFDTRRRCVADTLLSCHVTDFHVEGDGELWVADGRNVWHFDRDLQEESVLSDAPWDIEAFALDHQGGIWACTHSRGLIYRSPYARTIPYYITCKRGAVGALLSLEDGDVLVGAAKGLVRLRHIGDAAAVIPSAVVRLDRGREGLIYASTRSDGLIALDTTLKVMWRVDDRAIPSMRANVDFCIEMGDGRLLLNTRLNRLVIYDPRNSHIYHLMERFGNVVQQFRRIVDILPVNGGWMVATQNGLFALHQTEHGGQMEFSVDTKRFEMLNDNPWSTKCNGLLRSADGHILIATQNGLIDFDEATGQMVHYGSGEGLPANCIQSMVEDGEGRLWLATTRGLCILERSSRKALVMDETDGIEDCSFTERTAHRATDGHLLFGTEHGIYVLTPDSLDMPQMELKPRLLNVRLLNGEEIPPSGRAEISLEYYQNFLTFTISALNYAFPAHTHYRYRLTGVNKEWVEVMNSGAKLDLSFTALPPGSYKLEVQAAMQGQPWGPALVVPFVINPPLWHTWWAHLLYVLAAVALVYYLRRTYVQQREMRRRIDDLLRERMKNHGGTSTLEEETFVPNDDATAEPQSSGTYVAGEDVPADETPAPEPPKLTPGQRHFLEKAIKCVDHNLTNTDFTIDDFAREMAMERSTLYRHLQAVVGQSPLEFIRSIRLQHAAELLRKGKYNVTEVSELVGFNTPRYFSKYFKDMYGVRPSEFR